MGMNLKHSFFITTFGVALLVGATIPQTGTIGFIGLIAPHVARIILKTPITTVFNRRPDWRALLLLIADLCILYLPFFPYLYRHTHLHYRRAIFNLDFTHATTENGK